MVVDFFEYGTHQVDNLSDIESRGKSTTDRFALAFMVIEKPAFEKLAVQYGQIKLELNKPPSMHKSPPIHFFHFLYALPLARRKETIVHRPTFWVHQQAVGRVKIR